VVTASGTASAGAGNNPSISTATQLSILDQLVMTVNQVYLYPGFHGIDWPAIAAGYRKQIAAGVSTQTFYTDMDGVVTALGDKHSSFLSPAQVIQLNALAAGDSNHVGSGITYLALARAGSSLFVVTSVIPGSPAAHAGLKPHDSILAVNGHPVDENAALVGPPCSLEVLTVASPGGTPRKLTIVRDTLHGPALIDARLVHTEDGSRIGYIFLPTFVDATIPGQVSLALTNFGPLDGLILDDRTNSGGSQAVLMQILSYFTSGTLGRFVSRTSTQPFTVVGSPNAIAPDVPLVVLIGPHTFSAGELFAGMLNDAGRARLVGSTTSGTVESLHTVQFPDGSRALLAEARFDPAVSHADWGKTGIVPDVEVSAEWNTFTFDTDPAVAAALKLFGHQ
jgi:C-terminal peptidase prc